MMRKIMIVRLTHVSLAVVRLWLIGVVGAG